MNIDQPRTVTGRLDKLRLEIDAALNALDAPMFVIKCNELKEIALDNISQGLWEQGSDILLTIRYKLCEIKAKTSWRNAENYTKKTYPVEFVESVACLFSINSDPVISNLNISPELDSYLLDNKIDVHNFYAEESFKVLNLLAERGRVDDFISVLECQLNEWQDYQDRGSATGDHIRSVSAQSVSRQLHFFTQSDLSNPVRISSRVDTKLARLVSRTDINESYLLSKYTFKNMLDFGLRETLRVLIENSAHINFNQDDVDRLNDLSAREAGRLFAFNKNKPNNLMGRLMEHSLKDIKNSLKEFGLKSNSSSSGVIARSIIESAGDHYNSENYQDSHEEKLIAVLSVAVRHLFYAYDKDASIARSELLKARIPGKIQFKIKTINDNRAHILDSEMGL